MFIETDDFLSTGISDATLSEKPHGDYTCDLLERRVEMPVSGNIYIKNGKEGIDHKRTD